MKKWIFLFASQILLLGAVHAAPPPNCAQIQGCADICAACNSANVSCKTKKGVPFSGYIWGDHIDHGDTTNQATTNGAVINGGTPVSCGLWIDCVNPLMHGQSPAGLDLSPTGSLMTKYGNMAGIQAAAKTCSQNKHKMNL